MFINDILDNLNTNDKSYLENKTVQSINQEINETLSYLGEIEQDSMCQKLKTYRFVDIIYELHRGKYVRFVKKNDNDLKIGGIVVDIKFLDNGTHVVLLNKFSKKIIQFKFDDNYIFQKMTSEEQLILFAQS
jgi:hypothetical protein